MDFLSWFALAVLIFVILTLAYGMIAIHDIPYNIAKKRNHPHRDAIHAGGWISLFTLHAIWPFLWIWAYSYHPVYGYGGIPSKKDEPGGEESDELTVRLPTLEKKITPLQADVSESGSHRSK